MADQRTRKSPAHFLAPLALVAVLVAFLMIVGSSGDSGSAGSERSAETATEQSETTGDKTSSSTTRTTKRESDRGPRTYTVQVGDTLGGIADKTGVPLETIEELNPKVDPQAMTAGQKIKLR